jgi:hypothetical protein
MMKIKPSKAIVKPFVHITPSSAHTKPLPGKHHPFTLSVALISPNRYRHYLKNPFAFPFI